MTDTLPTILELRAEGKPFPPDLICASCLVPAGRDCRLVRWPGDVFLCPECHTSLCQKLLALIRPHGGQATEAAAPCQ